jgi:thymidylate synthase (FAD)
MKILDPGFEILLLPDETLILTHLEKAGRTCYKSEDKIAPGTAKSLLQRIVRMGHESVIEHASATVKFICDRGVSHELVRHRLASFSQESTRYANYAREKFGREISVIRPFFWQKDSEAFTVWRRAMENAEQAYLALIDGGATAQEARSVLPNSLKTEVVMTANLREWRHVFRLRCAAASHPQMREIMLPLLAEFCRRIPVLFADLGEQFGDDLPQEN